MRFIPAIAALLTAAIPAFAETRLEYNRDIRPILAENCFACHGPDSAARKADLKTVVVCTPSLGGQNAAIVLRRAS